MDIDKFIQLGKDGKFEELEAERERMYQEVMTSLPDDATEERIRKLEGLHFTTKNIKATSNNKIEAMNKSFDLMMASLHEMNDLLQQITNISKRGGSEPNDNN